MKPHRRDFLAQISPAVALPTSQGALSSSSGTLESRLTAAIDALEIINTHEHTAPEEIRIAQPLDFFTLGETYVFDDLLSAGLPRASRELILDTNAALALRWAAFEPFWRHTRFSGYAQALRIAIRDLYGFDEISLSTLPKINAAIAARNRRGLYRDILQRRARIRYAVWIDNNASAVPARPDPEFFVTARKFERFLLLSSAADVAALEQQTGHGITNLKSLKEALEKNFEQGLAMGMVAVKSIIAYDRDLLFQEVSEADAERDFESLMKGERELPQGFRHRLHRPFRNLEDYMLHQLVRLAAEHDCPVQVHTGMQANRNFVANSNPTLLTNLFFLYPQVKFDVFHMSYPYQSELAAIAKLFPNVYVDLCWAHVIAPGATRQALHEFLETVPLNKIMGFGGDYRDPELTYGHAVMARRNITRVLAERVQEGFCSEQEALQIAAMLLRDNPAALFPRREGARAPV